MEINRLKMRLKELEKGNLDDEEEAQLCTSTACGHDVVLSNLQKLCKDYNLKSLAVMACWEKNNEKDIKRWYTTNVSPQHLSYLIRDVKNILEFLSPVFNEVSLKILEFMLEGEKEISIEELVDSLQYEEDIIKERLESLIKNGFVKRNDANLSLTNRGWQTFIVLAHLTYVLDLKVPPEKAMPIAEAFMKVLGKQWGEHLGLDYEEVINRLQSAGWLEKLKKEGVTLEDIKNAVYENNCPV